MVSVRSAARDRTQIFTLAWAWRTAERIDPLILVSCDRRATLGRTTRLFHGSQK